MVKKEEKKCYRSADKTADGVRPSQVWRSVNREQIFDFNLICEL